VHWRRDLIVTANHALERDDEDQRNIAGRPRQYRKAGGGTPPPTSRCSKINGIDLPTAEIGETSVLKPGHFILAAACTAEGSPRAAMRS